MNTSFHFKDLFKGILTVLLTDVFQLPVSYSQSSIHSPTPTENMIYNISHFPLILLVHVQKKLFSSFFPQWVGGCDFARSFQAPPPIIHLCWGIQGPACQ